MALNLSGPGRDNDPDVIVDVNTTPLIDVMLVLLVMLIITIPIQLHSVNMNMPVGVSPPQTQPPEIVRIDIDAQGVVSWQGQPVADNAELQTRLRAAAAQAVQPEIHLRPNRLTRYAVVAHVLASAQRLGLTRLGIVGNEQYAK